MCGITGIFAFNEIGLFYGINLAKATATLAQRGPDYQGFYWDEYLSMGHRRLSIQDTSTAGSQPMKDEEKRYVIVFNGEIFNFKELREELQNKGIVFKSGSDTEVLLHLYIREKAKCLDKLNGFFAFAIYDTVEKELFIARDRYGIKPLLYTYDDDKFIFASEMKALMAFNVSKEIDKTSLVEYLQYQYVPGPQSMLKAVKKLSPGHYAIIRRKELHIKQYYEVDYVPGRYTSLSYEDAQKQLVELMRRSVEQRMISDVPLGAFLSGGIDSSVITALAAGMTDKLNTFSIGYKDAAFFDETKYAKLVAKRYNTEHTVFKLGDDDLHKSYRDVLNYLDEPFADSSAIPVYILSKLTREHVKVALSGDGADELFAGYHKHYGDYRMRYPGSLEKMLVALQPLWNMLPQSRNSSFSNKIRQFKRFADGAKYSSGDRYLRWCGLVTEDTALSMLHSYEDDIPYLLEERKKKHKRFFGNDKDINATLRTDVEMLLQNDMLVKVDMMSMANGLEVRVPFLDKHVVDFAFNLPESYKIDHKMKKKIVQDAFRDFLPKELYNRPKHGFDVPLLQWMKGELRSTIEKDLLNKDFVEAQGIFDYRMVDRLKTQLYSSNPEDAPGRIWGLIAFQWWYKKYIGEEKAVLS